jgi:pseudomonalisin
VDIPSQCNNSTPSPTALTGGLAGYLVGPGFDLVTGWGSLDVYNLLTNWGSAPSLAQPTIDLLLPQTIVSTAQSVTFSATVTGNGPAPTGTIQFEVDGSPLLGPVTLDSGMAISSPYMSGLLGVRNLPGSRQVLQSSP